LALQSNFDDDDYSVLGFSLLLSYRNLWIFGCDYNQELSVL